MKKISPFLTIMFPDEIYPANADTIMMLKHSAWLTNHWDDLINIQLNNIQEYGGKGIFYAAEKNRSDVEFKLEWLPESAVNLIDDTHIRKQLVDKLSKVNVKSGFIIYFVGLDGIDMAYHINILI